MESLGIIRDIDISDMGIPMMGLANTDWPFAGAPLSHAMQQALDKEMNDANSPAPASLKLHVNGTSQTYNISNGYLVPYYTLASHGDDLSRSAEEFTVDRVKRFLYTAEPQLDVSWTHEAIEQAKKEYQACDDPDIKSIKARYLSGAMANRIERLSRVYFQADLQGVKIDLNDEQEQALLNAARPLADLRLLRRVMKEHAAPEVAAREKELLADIRQALKPIYNEFGDYYQFLAFGIGDTPSPQTADTLQTVIDHVHLRDLSRDHDGILKHLAREMGKMWGFENLDMQINAKAGVINHISKTMQAIDETKETLLTLLHDPKVLRGLSKAANDYRGDLSEKSLAVRLLLEGGSTHLVEEYAAVCRARAGIKSDDAKSFAVTRERATLIEQTIYEVHKRLKRISRAQGEAATSEVRDILTKGFELMGSMAQLRIPRNRNAPAFDDQSISNDLAIDDVKDQSSVRRFQRSAQAWLSTQQEKRSASEGRG